MKWYDIGNVTILKSKTRLTGSQNAGMVEANFYCIIVGFFPKNKANVQLNAKNECLQNRTYK